MAAFRGRRDGPFQYDLVCQCSVARLADLRQIRHHQHDKDKQMGIDFKGRVAIVTGAGGGLGRQHALALARRGAKVLVNDLGGARDGSGGSVSAADAVVAEIRAAGGEAMANGASVTDFAAVEAMVRQAVQAWGRAAGRGDGTRWRDGAAKRRCARQQRGRQGHGGQTAGLRV